MKTIKRIIPQHLEEHHDGASWGVWSCTVEYDDGSTAEGWIDSDGHTIAIETLELATN